MYLLDNLAKFSLFFSHDSFLVPFIILGYIWLYTSDFRRALILILTTMPLTYILKNFFQVPLLPALGQSGFAFPSGHMQSCVTFYGLFFTLTHSKVLRAAIIMLLSLVGWALVHQGYHRPIDIFGAIFFGISVIFLEGVMHKYGPHLEGGVFLIANTLMICGIGAKGALPPHLIMSYCTLSSFLMTDRVLHFPQSPKSLVKKILLTIVLFSWVALCRLLAPTMLSSQYLELHWLFIGASLPCWMFFFSHVSISGVYNAGHAV